ncbi:MAG: MFS transporter [Candidatus Cyclobacteriaceae bacterium M3_2C_046]
MDELVRQRISLSSYFFISGLCFASWASRIPTIKTSFELNEAELGSILFAMPISSLIGLPISGWLVEKFDSRWPLFISFIFHALFLLFIGVADTVFLFTTAIFLFAFSNRISNIAMNTQAINLQNKFTKKINGSFHGLWSLGGIAGVGVTTLMVALNISLQLHFLIITLMVLIMTMIAFPNLLKKDKSHSGGFSLKKPDPMVMILGILIFFAAICEGGMFDWSGIFFKEVVNVEIFTAGYLMFMSSMAFSRFLSDWLIQHLGMPRMFLLSSFLIVLGLLMAILYPNFWMALIGFMIVGAGTASVVPMVFTLAGKSKRYSPGIAISLIATFALVGFMIGPPLIGYIAHAFNLRFSFLFIALNGLLIFPTALYYFKRHKGRQEIAVSPNLGEI